MNAPDPAFEELLVFVREARGFDYTAYKRPSLMRRFARRMQEVDVDSYEDYRHYLEAEPREFAELLNTILINVTGFFRDPDAWDHLAREAIPAILQRKEENETIRVWSAGCASGEEAYTAAFLLAEALDEERYRATVKIYATDIDEDALAEARSAAYEAKRLKGVPESLLERYFVEANSGLAVRGDIRRSVIFGRNDLMTDPPISRVDLIISRNTLMYFGPQAQQRILSNFYFALAPEGYLFLGKAEALHGRTILFVPVDLKHRLFLRSGEVQPEFRTAPPQDPAVVASGLGHRIREASFDHGPIAQLIVDLTGTVVLVNQHARLLFGLGQRDIGRRLQELEVSYRPLELRSLIDRSRDERRLASVRDVVWNAAGEERHFDVQIAPLVGSTGELLGTGVSFADVSRALVLRQELEGAKRDLESAYEELQSTVEELQTTNEELQSTNEELETTNEELQSTNEELETMNEELQSTNEELETMNAEMHERTDDALTANAFLSTILASIHQSVVVLDRDLRVSAWSDSAADLWGLREEEVEGRYFLNLDIGLSVGELRRPILDTLAGDNHDELVLPAHNRRGQPITCTITFAPHRSHRGEIEGAILVMTPEPRQES